MLPQGKYMVNQFFYELFSGFTNPEVMKKTIKAMLAIGMQYINAEDIPDIDNLSDEEITEMAKLIAIAGSEFERYANSPEDIFNMIRLLIDGNLKEFLIRYGHE